MITPVPTSIGGHHVVERLAEGTFGVVYRARSSEGTPVALKVAKALRPSMAGRVLVNQENEVEALLRLQHPNVVGVQSYGVDEQHGFYIAMEFAEGEILRDYTRGRLPMDAFEAIPIVQRVIDAVAHCHALDILHLDLKPENIVVVDPLLPRIKVLDFGLAHLTRAWTSRDAPAGTPAYMPPEAFSNAAPTTSQDLYAVGTILYELLAGQLPFGRFVEKVARDPTPLREVAPMVPAPLAELVHRMIARNPAERPPSAAAVRDELRRLYFAILQDSEPSKDVTESGVRLLRGLDLTPMVGRAAELAAIERHFEHAVEAEGRALLVRGEAGRGKSRLVSEALAKLQADRAPQIAYGRCRELAQLAPFSVVREAFGSLMRQLVEHAGPRAEAVRTTIIESLGEDLEMVSDVVPDLASLCRTAPRDDRSLSRLKGVEHLGAALREVLGIVAAASPVVLVLEDLHWADATTTELVDMLVSPAPPVGVLVLMTAREGLEPPDGVPVLPLSPLGETDTDRQVSLLFGGISEHDVARLKAAVPLLAAGNPLYTVQVLRHLVEEGLITTRDDGSLALADTLAAGSYSAPPSVRRVLERTVERMAPADRRVLGIAALMGRQFSLAALRKAGGLDAAEIDAVIERAVGHRVCHASGDDCLFVHDTVADQLAISVPADELQEVHGRIADAIVDSAAHEPGRRAHHLEQAQRRAEAAQAYFDAGTLSDALHDPAGAVWHLRRAIALLVELPATPERDALLRSAAHHLARMGAQLGANDEILQTIQAVSGAFTEPDVDTQVTLDAALARVLYTRGEFLAAVQRSQKVLAAVAQRPDLATLACAPSNILGRVLVASGKFGMASQMLTRGADLAAKAGEHNEVSHSEGLLSVALCHLGQYDEARRRARTCYALADRLGDPVRKAGAMFYFQVLAEASFDANLGVRYTFDLLRFIEEQQIGGLYLQCGTVFGGRHQFHLGRLDRAQVMLRNAIELSGLTKIGMAVGWAHGFLGDVYMVAGDYGRARASYETALQIGTQRSDEYAAPPALVGLCHLTAHTTGDAKLIVEYGDAAVRRFEEAHNRTAQVYCLQRYAEALSLIDDPRAAELLARRSALVDELGVDPEACDWWPPPPRILLQGGADEAAATDTKPDSSVPSSRMDTPVSQRCAVWQELGDARRRQSYDPAVAAQRTATVEDLGSTLAVDLSSRDGYIPAFANR